MSNGDDAATIRVPTKFTSVDQLVAKATPHVDGEIISAPTGGTKVGEQRWFQVLLADGTVALEGLGEVVSGSKLGTRLKIVDLDAESRIVHTKILAAKSARPPTGVRVPPAPFRKPGDSAPVAKPETPKPEAAPPETAKAEAPAAVPTPAPVITTLKSSPPPPAAPTDPAPAPAPAPATPSLPPPPAPASAPPWQVQSSPTASLDGWSIPETEAAPSPVAPTPTAPTGLPLAAPADGPAPAVAAPEPRQPTVEPTISVMAAWAPPAWLRDRRVKIAGAVAGVILLIGIIAAFAADDPPARGSAGPTPYANTQPPRTAPDAAPAPDDDPIADTTDIPDAGMLEDAAGPEPDAQPPIEPEDDPPPPPKKKPPPKKPPPKATPKKKPAASKQVRLDVRSEPAGATLKVNGSVVKGSTLVSSGSTVTITATKKGYKRANKTVKVTKSTSVVMKLQKM